MNQAEIELVHLVCKVFAEEEPQTPNMILSALSRFATVACREPSMVPNLDVFDERLSQLADSVTKVRHAVNKMRAVSAV